MRWKTDEIEATVRTVPNVSITREPPGGDYDTTTLRVARGPASCVVFGMQDLGTNPCASESPDDAEVNYLFACYSSKSGMVNAKTPDRQLALDLRVALEAARHTVYDEGYDSFV
jgi:hypothetical protein